MPGASGMEPGRKLVLGLRPEHFSRADGGGRPTLPARVEVVEPTGAETIVVMRLGDSEVTARFEPDTAPAEGEAINLAVAVNKACLFDPETGIRL
jgi:multiple sugar transport system ATP-binding protein